MRRASGNAALSANQMASGMGPSWSRNGAIIAAFKNLFPQHTRKTLADFLGLSDGAARKKLTGERALSVDELATLLRSEHGLDFLAAIMNESRPQVVGDGPIRVQARRPAPPSATTTRGDP